MLSKFPVLLTVVALAGIAVMAGTTGTTNHVYAGGDVAVIAHRGASGLAPENTIAAFDLALELRADYVELDVQMSRDGTLVVMHDTSLDRTTNGRGFIGDKRLAELRELDAGGRFSKEFTGERIPLLEEVLDRYWGKIGILLELKEPNLYPGMVEETVGMVRARLAEMEEPYAKHVIIQSFDREAIRAVREQAPEIATGLLLRADRRQMSAEDWESIASFADYVNPHKALVNAAFVEMAHEHGLQVFSWTVRKKSEARRLIQAGVDGLITDYP